MFHFSWKLKCCILIYLSFCTNVFCDELKKEISNRSKRTVGLLLQSLANFLNVPDVIDTTTQVSITTTVPNHKRKSTPVKVQKWPPLDLDITPWVLQPVPVVSTPSPSPSAATSTGYPTTDEPNIHAQVVIIPFTGSGNELNSINELQKEPHEYKNTERVNGIPTRYNFPVNHQSLSQQNHQHPPNQATSNHPSFASHYGYNYQGIQQNQEFKPLKSNQQNQQTQVYYFRRLVPDSRIGKQIQYLQNSNTDLIRPNSTELPDKFNLQSKQLQINHQHAEALFKLGYLYAKSMKDEISNLGGNDYNRETQDKYRSFIDLEPNIKHESQTTRIKNKELSELYLSERNRRLKPNSLTKPIPDSTINIVSDNSGKTDVQIIKSIEQQPIVVNDSPPYEEVGKVSEVSYGNDKAEGVRGGDNDSTFFEMVKSLEPPFPGAIPDSGELGVQGQSHGNSEYSGTINTLNSGFSGINGETITSSKHQIINNKIQTIHPSQKANYYYQKNRATSNNGNNNFNSYTPENIYRNVYESIMYSTKNKNDIDHSTNPIQSSVSYNKTAFHYPEQNYPTIKDNYEKVQENHKLSDQLTTNAKLRYNNNFGNINQNYYSTQFPSERYRPKLKQSHNDNNQQNSQALSTENIQGKGYVNQYVPHEGNLFNPQVGGLNNYPLHDQNAQVHVFIPDEQSLISPQIQDKPFPAQYSQGASQEYFENSSYFHPYKQFEENNEADKFTAVSSPRLPDNIHDQLNNGNDGVRKNILPPPMFDEDV